VQAVGLALTPSRLDDPTLEQRANPGSAETFDSMLERWFPLSYLLNNLHRSLGMPDGYQFTLAATVIHKLRFVHERLRAGSSPAAAATEPAAAAIATQ
jgi:hypothetical protein